MKKEFLHILILFGLFAFVQPVRADIAPPPGVELEGIRPAGSENTEVEMLYERVEMELGSFYDEKLLPPTQNRVLVNAYFLMENTGSKDESMQVVFPSRSAPICRKELSHGERYTVYDILQESFQVIVDGNIVPLSIVKLPFGDCQDFEWIAFDANFPVGKQVLIKVSYEMQTFLIDVAQEINYILETGSGWKGTIRRGYVILKFPYTVTSENILSGTTRGYQTLYNEIYWPLQDLEPTSADNVHIYVVSPNTWLDIQRLRTLLERSPENPEAWLELTNNYIDLGLTPKGDRIKDEYYLGLIEPAFQQAISYNPNNAELYAQYAEFIFEREIFTKPQTHDVSRILPLVNKALALEPDNKTANRVANALIGYDPQLTFTPPATIPPTSTLAITSTPSLTPTTTITPKPSQTPVVVTVVRTKLVQMPTATKTQKALEIVSITPDLKSLDLEEKPNSSIALVFMVVFVVGAGVGWFLSKHRN